MNVAELGDLSTTLVWGAATAYTVALIAYTLDLARLTERAGSAARAARQAVAVGGAVTAAGGAVAGGRGSARAGATATLAPVRPAADRSSKARGIARSTTILGLLLQVAAVVLRGIAAGRTPWANMYEFALVGTMVAVAVLLLVLRKRDLPFLGVAVTGLTVLALAVALLVFYVQADGVQPALDSYWLVIHVGVAITAAGVFTVAFAASVLQLLRSSRERGSAALSRPVWRWLDTVPGPGELEALSFRLNAVGFVLWTFTVIAGAIWAEHAWGRYWGWDPKEVWSFVIWVVYAAYLHARTTRGWAGRRAAWFVLVGYSCVIANFTLVNLFFAGKHTYSGL
ncbi:c-type cytochrome biogenesis protein CcsB [Pengzhenrongella frigida]|uniref:C-type cytochrome biogenesis protein CcsB n=1 Tax=Pengzhenrongella frigida TaxID=1259133 RepID=A0A4Q5N1Z6_9MICO|nr:c-type cytochrome biogenesis protein CcsB [Cellulomonas sp. HLT2-17]RYV50051.1 c-type cytochrome biogenesis protein CcsB [Cellulomonas sp. HLT2-17]